MSLELYYIDEYNTSKLILRNWDTNELKPATWQQLILVKAPVTKGPEQIQRHIKQLEKNGNLKTITKRNGHTLSYYTYNCECN